MQRRKNEELCVV